MPPIFTFALLHSICFFVFPKHFRVILFLDLDIRQQFSNAALTKVEYIGIVLAGNQFFCSDTIGCQCTVILLVLWVGHGIIGCFRGVILAVAVIAVTAWNGTVCYL